MDRSVSARKSTGSAEDALQLVDLAKEALGAHSFEEFVGGVLPAVAAMMQSRVILLYVNDSRWAAPRLFQVGLGPEVMSGMERLCDEQFDQTRWFEGDRHVFSHAFKLPKDLTPGDYAIAVALVDKDTQAPAIALGIQGRDPDGRYILGPLTLR